MRLDPDRRKVHVVLDGPHVSKMAKRRREVPRLRCEGGHSKIGRVGALQESGERRLGPTRRRKGSETNPAHQSDEEHDRETTEPLAPHGGANAVARDVEEWSAHFRRLDGANRTLSPARFITLAERFTLAILANPTSEPRRAATNLP